MDAETKNTLRIIRAQLDLGQEVEEEINWEDVKPVGVDIDTIFDKISVYTSSFKQKLYQKFKKSKEIIHEDLPEHQSGDELTRELEDAWNLYSRVRTDQLGVQFLIFCVAGRRLDSQQGYWAGATDTRAEPYGGSDCGDGYEGECIWHTRDDS